jgi:predicted double-glycine peptidase
MPVRLGPRAAGRAVAAVLLLGALAPAARAATTASAARWLPLRSGNRWALEDAVSGALREVRCDAATGAERHVTGLFGGSSDAWLGYRASFPSSLYVIDAAGQRTTLARFAAARDARWELEAVLPGDAAPSRIRAEWTAAGEWIEAPAGTFADCRRLALALVTPASARSAAALDRAIWLSPDYGIVRIEGPAGEDFLLAEAEIGGDRYPTWRDRTPAPPPDPGTALLLSVPDVEQATDYSCGPAALEAVLAHYGVAVAQRALSLEAKTSPRTGAEAEDLAAAALRHGVAADYRSGRTLAELEQEVARGDPPIAMIQAWRDKTGAWARDWDDGHYVVVIGLDARAVYVEDPSTKGARGVIPRAEFLDRWHGWTRDGKKAQRQALFFRAAGPGPAPVLPPPGEPFAVVE